jgi:predicted dehydrogenase/threonine dehydrogenase-like Zn-dependent dehydrogenase
MKQLLQNLKTGRITVEEVPPPTLRPGGILVRSSRSLISAGTERMLLKLAKQSLVGKARQRPDLVRRVLVKARREGLLAAYRALQDRLDREVPVGYSVCGEVLEVGSQAGPFEIGQRVACAGAGYANHAEINYVPRLLAVPVPAGVGAEAAAYATVGAIALQGIRNAKVGVGEAVVVIGLGLVGQLAVQLLKACGCRVVGLDPAADRVALAASQGAALAGEPKEDLAAKQVLDFTRGRGADAVLITAATASNAPVELAARLARDRARVVMVGVTAMDLPRKPYYEKELTFVVSRSYGPGRYDRQYEEHGHDYPAGYVRWTENRNLEAFLDLVASGAVRPDALTTHRFPLDEAMQAFELILSNREPHLGVILTYPEKPAGAAPVAPPTVVLRRAGIDQPSGKVGASFLGAGSFARSVLLPALKKLADVELRGIATASGASARSAGKKFGFAFCASTEDEIYRDPATDAVFIVTPHSQHADMVCRALAAGKSVFVEKPLAITLEQLGQVREAMKAHAGALMVGFNRRFASLAVRLKEFVRGFGPMTILYRCNAGPLPADHWIADPAEGGRILGEACHFVDFFAYLTDAVPQTVFAATPSAGSGDDAQITVTCDDGSVCHLVYASGGPPSLGKERVEVFAGGRAAVLEDFRSLQLHHEDGRIEKRRLLRPDKGHSQELAAFLAAIRCGGEMPIPPESLCMTTLVTFAALRSLQRGKLVRIAEVQREGTAGATGQNGPPDA